MNQRAQWQKLEKKFLAYLLSDKLYIGQAMSKMKRSYFVNIRNIYKFNIIIIFTFSIINY